MSGKFLEVYGQNEVVKARLPWPSEEASRMLSGVNLNDCYCRIVSSDDTEICRNSHLGLLIKRDSNIVTVTCDSPFEAGCLVEALSLLKTYGPF